MSHPFFDFFELIAHDDDALRAFAADPDGDPRAAALTAAQKAALMSRDFVQVQTLLFEENRNVRALLDPSQKGPASAAEPSSVLIGWNMVAPVLEKIDAASAP
jgi:hypothetical protein